MRMKYARLALAVLVTAACGLYVYSRVTTVRERYREVPTGATTPESSSAQAISEMSKQNELFLNWAVLLLAGSLGLLTAKEPLQIRAVEWAYTLFTGPPAILLLGSAWTGWRFKARLTYLLATGNEDWRSLNDLLSAQAQFFLTALLLLSLLGGWLVIERIAAPMTPTTRNHR